MNPSGTVGVASGDVAHVVDTIRSVGLWIYDFVTGLTGWLVANIGVLPGPPEAILGLLIVVPFVGAL